MKYVTLKYHNFITYFHRQRCSFEGFPTTLAGIDKNFARKQCFCLHFVEIAKKFAKKPNLGIDFIDMNSNAVLHGKNQNKPKKSLILQKNEWDVNDNDHTCPW